VTLSTRNEEKLRTAFAALVDVTPVGADFEALTEGQLVPTRRRWSGLAVMATAAIATVVVLAPLMLLGNRTGPSSTTGDVAPPVGIPEGAPSPGSVAPFLETPPVWFGEPVAAARPAADRTGRWVSAAIGVEASDGLVSSPVTVAVTDGTLRGLEDAEEVVIDGRTLRSLQIGGWQTLATVGEPAIVISGVVDTALLSDVLNATTVVATSGGDSLAISHLPAGYVERVAPQLQAEDIPHRRTLTNTAGDISINEISDWVDPELAAASSGADYAPVEVNGEQGWTGHTESNPYGPLTFLVWSPQPGVVFEVVTTNDERSTEHLVELATATSAISANEWDQALAQ
jgi:hypothetical protein